MMRIVKADIIKDVIKRLCVKANIKLRPDILLALKSARDKERFFRSRRILDIIIKNASIAKKKKLPICQDTGMVVVYLKIGQDVIIKGDLKKAIDCGVEEAYREYYFRKSIVSDPLLRKNTSTNLPAIIYTEICPGRKIKIKVAIKGFGCENTSRTKMFLPGTSSSTIEDFVIDTLKEVGSRSCPPVYIGVGIGGTLDKAVALSKEAIFRPIGKFSDIPHIAKMEKNILSRVNKLGIGPGGVGRGITALGVSILTYPTHIAGLPVAVYISCHATRDAEESI